MGRVIRFVFHNIREDQLAPVDIMGNSPSDSNRFGEALRDRNNHSGPSLLRTVPGALLSQNAFLCISVPISSGILVKASDLDNLRALSHLPAHSR